jgi:hypothetical protein
MKHWANRNAKDTIPKKLLARRHRPMRFPGDRAACAALGAKELADAFEIE